MTTGVDGEAGLEGIKSILGRHFTIDEVVFAESVNLLLLGEHTLEGLNITVDSVRKKLGLRQFLCRLRNLRQGVQMYSTIAPL